MAEMQAFLKQMVLRNEPSLPRVVKVFLHVHGPLEDGSEVKDVADSEVYVRAVFTSESLKTFSANFEDSFNSPPDWDEALLILNQFRVEFQPSFAPENTDRKARFVMVVDQFSLHNMYQGFFDRHQPQNLMEDPEIQAKAEEMEKCQIADREQKRDTEGCDHGVSLSLLLDQMGQSSLADMSQSQCEQDRKTPKVPERERGAIVTVRNTRQSIAEKLCSLNPKDFVVSSEQQVLLDLIPEWKDDYMPPAKSSEEQQSSVASSDSLAPSFEGATLRSEEDKALSHPSFKTTLPAATEFRDQKKSGLVCSQRGETQKTATVMDENDLVGKVGKRQPAITAGSRQTGGGTQTAKTTADKQTVEERQTARTTRDRQTVGDRQTTRTIGDRQTVGARQTTKTIGDRQTAGERQTTRTIGDRQKGGERQTMKTIEDRQTVGVRQTTRTIGDRQKGGERQTAITTADRQTVGERKSVRVVRKSWLAKTTEENRPAITEERRSAKITGPSKGDRREQQSVDGTEDTHTATAVKTTGPTTSSVTVRAVREDSKVVSVEDCMEAELMIEDEAGNLKQLCTKQDSGSCTVGPKHSCVIHKRPVYSSGTSQDCAVKHGDVSFTLSSPDNLEDSSSLMDDDCTSPSVGSISQPVIMVLSVSDTEDGDAVNEKQWQQKEKEIAAGDPPLDKTRHLLVGVGNALTAACQPACADGASAACLSDHYDSASDGEIVTTAESGTVGMSGLTRRKEQNNSSRVSLEKDISCVEKLDETQDSSCVEKLDETQDSSCVEKLGETQDSSCVEKLDETQDSSCVEKLGETQDSSCVEKLDETQDSSCVEKLGETQDSSCVEKLGETQSFKVPSPVVFASTEETEKTCDEKLSFSGGFDVQTTQGFASQGFVPSDLAEHSLLPAESFVFEDKDDHTVCVRDSAQDTQNFIHSRFLTQADEQFVTDTVRPDDGQDKIQHRDSPSGQNRMTGRSGRNKIRLSSMSCQTSTAQTERKAYHKSSCQSGQPANTCYDQGCFCSHAHTTEEPAEQCVYHSTQNSSTENSQSPSFLDMSAIYEHSDCLEKRHYISVLQSDEAESLRLADFQKSCTGTEMCQKALDSDKVRTETVTVSGQPVKISKYSDVCVKSSTDAETSKVLVACSWSSDSADQCDHGLTGQVSGQAMNTVGTEGQPGSDTMVIPESSPEGQDIIVISSDDSSEHTCGKSPKLTVGAITANRRGIDHISRNHASSDGSGLYSDKAISKRPASKGYSQLETGPNQTQISGNQEMGKDMCSCTDTTKNSSKHIVRGKKNCLEQEKDKSGPSKDISKNRRMQDPGQKGVCMVSQAVDNPSTPASIHTDSNTDRRQEEPYVHNSLISPRHKRVRSPQYEDTLQHRKRPKQDRPVSPQLNSVEGLQCSRTVNRNKSEHWTVYNRGTRSASEHVGQTETGYCNLKQMTLCKDGSLQSVTTMKNDGKTASHSKGISSRSRAPEGSTQGMWLNKTSHQSPHKHTQGMWLNKTSHQSPHKHTQQQSTPHKAKRTPTKIVQLEIRSKPQNSPCTGHVRTTHRQTTASKHSRRQDGHAPRQAQERTSIPGASCLHRTDQTQHSFGSFFSVITESSSDELEAIATKPHTHKKKAAGSKKRPAHCTNINARKRCSRERSVNYSSEDDPSSEHNSGYVEQTQNKTKRYDRSQRHGSVDRKELASTSAAQSSDGKRGCQDAPSICNTRHPQRARSSRHTRVENVSVRQRCEDSETVQKAASDTVFGRADLGRRMKNSVNAWLEFRARSEDPKQKRLRQLKLAEGVIKKIQTCLSKP